jgi:hypothetical protein
MRRMVLVAVLCAAPAFAQDPRRADGGVWDQPNANPLALTADAVDAQMWPIVSRINQSGWVWTTESCQGHVNGYPMVLGVVTDDLGRFLALLAQAQSEAQTEDLDESQDPHGLSLMVSFFVHPQVRLGRYQVRLTLTDPLSWPLGLRVFEAVSRRTNDHERLGDAKDPLVMNNGLREQPRDLTLRQVARPVRRPEPMHEGDARMPVDRAAVTGRLEQEPHPDTLYLRRHAGLVQQRADVPDGGLREHHIEGTVRVVRQVARIAHDSGEAQDGGLRAHVEQGDVHRAAECPDVQLLPAGQGAANVEQAERTVKGRDRLHQAHQQGKASAACPVRRGERSHRHLQSVVTAEPTQANIVPSRICTEWASQVRVAADERLTDAV